MKENIDSKRQRLEELYNELDSLQEAFNRTLAAQSWATRDGMSSRDVTNPDLADLAWEIREKRKEIDALEFEIENDGFTGLGLAIGGLF